MDLNASVTYRGYDLNSVAIQQGTATGDGIAGSQVDSVDMSDVDVVQFTEKRSQQDGMDVGPPYLGMRRIRMQGTLYGRTRALLYDATRTLKSVLSPTLAYRSSLLGQGYLPLYFSEPTSDTGAYSSGVIDLRVLAMPRALRLIYDTDTIGGDETDALAIPWSATLVCKDPLIYSVDPVDLVFANTSHVSGTFVNRGDYHSSVNMLFYLTSAAGTITVQIGSSTFVIAVPASSGTRTIRIDGQAKTITVEESGIVALAYSYLTFTGLETWPLIDGAASYDVTFASVGLVDATSSHLWFYEVFA